MIDDVEARLEALGLSLPTAPWPAANYIPYCLAHNFLYISGQIPRGPSGIVFPGRLGAEVSLEQGQKAAELCALYILAQVKTALGGFSRVRQCVRLTGFVASAGGFYDHAQVVNGASDLMFAALGEKGRHTRAAVGMANLPFNSAVEVDAVFALD